MKQNDIDRHYTETVAKYLADGYQIHTATMGGSQGEIAHIDLRKESDLLRVFIETAFDCEGTYRDILAIKVGRVIEPIDKISRTIWNTHLAIISEIRLVRIDRDFYADIEEGRRMAELQRARRTAQIFDSTERRELTEAYKSIALRWLRKQPHMKTCRLKDITRLTKRTWPKGVYYQIEARGKVFFLGK